MVTWSQAGNWRNHPAARRNLNCSTITIWWWKLHGELEIDIPCRKNWLEAFGEEMVWNVTSKEARIDGQLLIHEP